jgi:hypothetical protein
MKPRFSLRTLFVIMTLIAAVFGWRKTNFARAQRMASLLSSGDHQRSQRELNNASFLKQALKTMGECNPAMPTVSATINESGSWRNWWLPSLKVSFRASVPGEKVIVGPIYGIEGKGSSPTSLECDGMTFHITQSLTGF